MLTTYYIELTSRLVLNNIIAKNFVYTLTPLICTGCLYKCKKTINFKHSNSKSIGQFDKESDKLRQQLFQVFTIFMRKTSVLIGYTNKIEVNRNTLLLFLFDANILLDLLYIKHFFNTNKLVKLLYKKQCS